ncbi:gfo/Idh/MocA family oxidoreductase [Granulicella sp. 5B5]|uniref:Gfo/Idh/MocA family protein n=1 Tax=Granulicella sp. 5B5 TaxID=1617967 RepID=UPI0015F6C05F|nr:Gfo/Idh/MocA family oxidoreductase [Granulicella sp. 5B5]QMV18830.1 gfo/Idh/MocA family oxidoreductase [Granulicella sp. 5B5]
MPPLRVAVIGTGAFGRNHLRVYRELEAAHPGLVQLAAFVDTDEQRRTLYASQYNIPAFATVNELLDTGLQLDAASVCVPTIHHAAVAELLLLSGIDVLIEKPFAATLAEADHLLSLARERDRILAVGHLERFNPAVTATLAALNKPMFFEAHRLSIFTPRSLDVDVVLDLMIHDLDIVLSLTNSPVYEVRAVGIPILSQKADIANVRVEFESGCVANFTASRISTEQVRKLRLFQPHQYLSLDFARQELLSIDVDPRLVAGLAAVADDPQLAAQFFAQASAASPDPSHPTAGFSLTKADIPKGEPLLLEIEDFLQAIKNRTPPRVSGEAGRAALALALDINDHIAAHTHRAGLA